MRIAEQNPASCISATFENIGFNADPRTISRRTSRGATGSSLRAFGAFSVKRRDARVGRNPRTGETVEVGEKAIPVFKTGKEMRLRPQSRDPTSPESADGRATGRTVAPVAAAR